MDIWYSNNYLKQLLQIYNRNLIRKTSWTKCLWFNTASTFKLFPHDKWHVKSCYLPKVSKKTEKRLLIFSTTTTIWSSYFYYMKRILISSNICAVTVSTVLKSIRIWTKSQVTKFPCGYQTFLYYSWKPYFCS